MAGFDITTAEGSESVCYILLPEGAVSDIAKWADKASSKFNCNIVLVSGMDWNRDMSPWAADGVMKEKKNFSGGAGMYLKELTDDFIPNVEQWLKLKAPKRYLLGISLSGLFAIWSLAPICEHIPSLAAPWPFFAPWNLVFGMNMVTECPES